MAVWSGDEMKRYISISEVSQIQPAGIDLTVGEIFIFKSAGILTRKTRELPALEKLKGEKWHLTPGAYLVRYAEKVEVPHNAIGIVLPRSSLLRMGATIFSAVWDPGYVGRGVGLLTVFNPRGITLEKGARVAQMIFIDARAKGRYRGLFLREGLKST